MLKNELQLVFKNIFVGIHTSKIKIMSTKIKSVHLNLRNQMTGKS